MLDVAVDRTICFTYRVYQHARRSRWECVSLCCFYFLIVIAGDAFRCILLIPVSHDFCLHIFPSLSISLLCYILHRIVGLMRLLHARHETIAFSWQFFGLRVPMRSRFLLILLSTNSSSSCVVLRTRMSCSLVNWSRDKLKPSFSRCSCKLFHYSRILRNCHTIRNWRLISSHWSSSDGRIQIMIWFKSWLNHIWLFDLTARRFDLEVWFDLWFEQVTTLSGTQCSTTLANSHVPISKPKLCVKNSHRTQVICVLSHFQIIVRQTVCHLFSSSETSGISDFGIWPKLWFDLGFGLKWFVIWSYALRFDLWFGIQI